MHNRALIALVLAALAVPTVVLAQDDSYTLSEGAPVLGRSAIVRVVSGKVLVRAPGAAEYRRLTSKSEAIRMGSFIDARAGRVRITVMRTVGSEQTSAAVFYDGKFQITQA